MPREKLKEVRSGSYGVGLRGIRERIRQFYGELNVESGNTGTKIVVTIPLSEPESEEARMAPAELKVN